MNKKFISTMLVAAVISGSVAYPHRAHAIVGAATANPLLMIAGGVTMGAGVILGGTALGTAVFTTDTAAWTAGGFGIAALVVGLILLDEQDGRMLMFSELTEAGQKKLGISEDQAKAYNSEIPNLTAIAETMAQELSLFDQMKLKKSETAELKNNKSAVLWEHYKSSISQESIEVIQKIRANLLATSH